MTTEEKLASAVTLLAPWTKGTKTPEPNRLDFLIDAADLLAAVKALNDAHWGYLVAITGLDYLGKTATLAQDARWKDLVATAGVKPDTAALEVLYFFGDGPAMVTLRLLLAREGASVNSVCSISGSASFYERELSEMFGITVVNTPDPNRLFLSEDWPNGVYPLRKDFVPAKTE